MNKKSVNGLILFLFFIIFSTDRIITIIHFGFSYTDVDQLVMWNGAVDYSKGIFHEPFFYGQPYNYMLESFVAAPLLYFNVPVYMAMPIATNLITFLPFIFLSWLFFKKQKYFWAYLCVSIPVLMPLEFNFLTTLSRGFVQALLFIPLLFIPLFNPEIKKNLNYLFIGFALCFIANPSSILLTFPVVLYVASFHFKSKSFYIKSLWMLPIFSIDFIFKYYYTIHPEKILHDNNGIELKFETFIDSLSNSQLFEHLIPVAGSGGIIYPVLFIILGIFAYKKGLKQELLFVIACFVLLLITLAIPKVQDPYPIENAGVFFTSSRFYIILPLLTVISSYLVFKNYKIKQSITYFLLGICLLFVVTKNQSISNVVRETITKTSFPITSTQELVLRTSQLEAHCLKYDIDLMVHKMNPTWSWNNLYDSYAMYPLTYNKLPQNKKLISVNLNGDRRSWLYENTGLNNQILLIGFDIDSTLLAPLDYEILDKDYILIKNNKVKNNILFKKLNCEFGNFIP